MILAFVPDLMDRSRLSAAATVTFVDAPDDLIGRQADIVIVDVSRPGALAAVPGITSPTIIGFASHVDTAVMDAARAAGCTEVIARSVFFGRRVAQLSR